MRRALQESDFALLCERHATSKLRQFDDLETIQVKCILC